MSSSAEEKSQNSSHLDQVVTVRKALFDKEYTEIMAVIHEAVENCKQTLMVDLDRTCATQYGEVEHLSNVVIDYAIDTFKLPGVTVERSGNPDYIVIEVSVDNPTPRRPSLSED